MNSLMQGYRSQRVSKMLGRLAVMVMVSWAVGLSGCQGGNEVKEEAHHIPEHLPANFDRAVGRIEQLVSHLKDGAALEKMPTEVNVETELRDVVRWLPELAAQSDLTEVDWNLVDGATMELIDQFAKAKESPEKWIGQGAMLEKIGELPKQLAEVRQRFRDMQVPDEVVEEEPATDP
jgi:hypothetical protein